MACYHKFREYLNLEKIDFLPETLIVGTFNPSWPENNYAEWFYGRTSNNYFWDVLPRIYNPSLNLRKETPKIWKAFCQENKIALTDLITSINDANQLNVAHKELLKSYDDSKITQFTSFTFTDVIAILERFPSITRVVLTRKEGLDFFENLWQPVQKYCKSKGIFSAMLLTPSKNARFQLASYKKRNPTDKEPLRNFIYESWRDSWS
jgi:hypothetical protein